MNEERICVTGRWSRLTEKMGKGILDDAVSLVKGGRKDYILGVHIADVTNYVQENSTLTERGTGKGYKCISGRPCDPHDKPPHTLRMELCLRQCRRGQDLHSAHHDSGSVMVMDRT